MSEKLQGFVLFLPTIGGQDAVDVLLDGIVFPHTLFQASVFGVQPIAVVPVITKKRSKAKKGGKQR